MVKEIEGHGCDYSQLAKRDGIDLQGYRRVGFPLSADGSARLKSFLEALAKLPDVDECTYFYRDVAGSVSRMNLLLIPRSAPSIYPNHSTELKDLPETGSTWLVTATKKNSARRGLSILVLADCQEEAAALGVDRATWILRVHPSQISTATLLLTPEEFLEEARAMIKQGFHLGETILRYGDLRDLAKRVERERINTSDISMQAR